MVAGNGETVEIVADQTAGHVNNEQGGPGGCYGRRSGSASYSRGDLGNYEPGNPGVVGNCGVTELESARPFRGLTEEIGGVSTEVFGENGFTAGQRS